jgi:hypothetical protein
MIYQGVSTILIWVSYGPYEDGGAGADSCTGENRPYFAAAAFFLGVCGESMPSLPFALPFAKEVKLCVEPFELVWACEWEWLCP